MYIYIYTSIIKNTKTQTNKQYTKTSHDRIGKDRTTGYGKAIHV